METCFSNSRIIEFENIRLNVDMIFFNFYEFLNKNKILSNWLNITMSNLEDYWKSGYTKNLFEVKTAKVSKSKKNEKKTE